LTAVAAAEADRSGDVVGDESSAKMIAVRIIVILPLNLSL